MLHDIVHLSKTIELYTKKVNLNEWKKNLIQLHQRSQMEHRMCQNNLTNVGNNLMEGNVV
jgi:hypothetical protein